MDANEIAGCFKVAANSEITKDSVARQIGLLDLYYAAEKYGRIDKSSFDAAMKRYFLRCNYNAEKSAQSLAAYEVYYIKCHEIDPDSTEF